MRWSYRSFLILIIAVVTGLGSLLIVMPNKSFSEAENRYLAQFPDFSWSKLVSGDFGRDFENYIADQFPWRDRWVALKAWVELALNKKENNGVYVGKEGYLLEKLGEATRRIEEQTGYVRHFADEINVPVYFMLVPSAAEMLTSHLPDFVEGPGQKEYMEKVWSLSGGDLISVDIYESMADHTDEYIYYRTDHHWTTLGAYYAYRVFAEQAGLPAMSMDAFEINRVSEKFYGSLSAKSQFPHVQPDTIDIWEPVEAFSHQLQRVDDGRILDGLYDWKALEKRDQYPLFLGGNYGLGIIETPQAPDRTLLLIKDSFAHSLVPFLAPHYRYIHMVDLRYVNFGIMEYVQQIEAEEVLLLYNVATFQSDDNLMKLQW